MKNILIIEKLFFNFGALTVANNICLKVKKSEIHALIGPNGAGKTTLVDQIYGSLFSSSGNIYLNKKNITKMDISERVHLGIRRSFQINNTFEDFTVIENILIAIQSLGREAFIFSKPSFSEESFLLEAKNLIHFINLDNKQDHLVSSLSHGEKRLLEIGLTIIGNPKLLILDEPLAGAGIHESKFIINMIKKLKKSVTILLIEHDMDAVFKLADTITVLVDGKIIASGSKKEISNNRKVKDAYLGS